MIQLDFTVPPHFLAYYCLAGRRAEFFINGKFAPLVVALQEKAKQLSPETWEFLKDEYPAQLLREREVKTHQLSTKLAQLDDLISKLIETTEFKAIFQPTLAAMNTLRHDWEETFPRFSKLSDFIADGKDRIELKVFVSSSLLELEWEALGDIYTGALNEPKYSNCLHVWSSLLKLRLHPINEGTPREIADKRWIADLIAALGLEEVRSQLFKTEFEPLPKTSERNYSKAYVRDLACLVPVWKEYMQSDQKKSLSAFRKQASDLLYTEWEKLRQH